LRVFIGPLEVAGIAAGLAQGLREGGHEADLVFAYAHRFAYGGARDHVGVAGWWARAGRWRQALPRSRPVRKALAFALQQLLGWAVLAWAVRRHDAFVFLYGETITNTALELWLLRRLGKRTVVVFVGSDSRPPYIDGGWFPADRPFDAQAAAAAARRQRAKVQRLERGASVCVNAPATGHFHARRFVHWLALGIPREVPAEPAEHPPREVIRALHGPSHPVLKGTARIREAVKVLRERGVELELATIEGRPNAEVLAALSDCDLVLDQLYSDTPMAAFATEAASLGRAVLVGGYAARSIAADAARHGLPLPPTAFVEPEAFEAELARLAADAEARLRIGDAGRAFVAAHWTPAAVAGRLLRVLEGTVPEAWWVDPAEVAYLQGCGLPEAVSRERVRALVERCGASALQLDDKPALRDAFVAFARGGAAAGCASSGAKVPSTPRAPSSRAGLPCC
jgi:glycosyltransferase involved in cell wall biosynthesis